MDEIENFGKAGQRPGAWVQQIQRRDGVEVRKERVHPCHTEHAGAQDHKDGRHHGFAQPARGGDRAVHKGGDAVGQTHDGNTLHPGVDNVRLGGKEREKLPPESKQPAAQHQPHAKAVGQADEVAFLYAVDLACAIVLAHKAGAGHIKRRHGVVDHGVGVGSSRVALNHQRVKRVDARLDEQVGNGKNGVLQTGGHAQQQDAPGHAKVQLDGVQVQRVAVPHFGQRVQDQPGRHALRNGAGQRHAHNVELTDDDKKQVEHDVQSTCDGQINQRLFGIADGAEHRIAEVIQRQRRHAQEVHTQVQNCAGQQIRLGVEQFQQRGRAEQADKQ